MALADAEDLSATNRTDGLSCWCAILQSYDLGIFHFSFGPAFNTIGFQIESPCKTATAFA